MNLGPFREPAPPKQDAPAAPFTRWQRARFFVRRNRRTLLTAMLGTWMQQAILGVCGWRWWGVAIAIVAYFWFACGVDAVWGWAMRQHRDRRRLAIRMERYGRCPLHPACPCMKPHFGMTPVEVWCPKRRVVVVRAK